MNDSSIQVPPALYMAQGEPSGSCHIIDDLHVELLLYIHVLDYVLGTLRGGGHCNLNVKMVLLYSHQKALVSNSI